MFFENASHLAYAILAGNVIPEGKDFSLKIIIKRGRPRGLVVRFGALHFGGLGSVPGRGPTPVVSHVVVVTHIQNRGRLAQRLAQGESSSSKKRKIGTDVSSGRIFLKQKKEEDGQQMLAQGESCSAKEMKMKMKIKIK